MNCLLTRQLIISTGSFPPLIKGGGSARERIFLAVSILLFAVSTLVTVIVCISMSHMAAMTMPGGWTMSMMWMRMPEQTWLGAAAVFVAMWIIMMMAMMLPSLIPMLRRYRHALAKTHMQQRGKWITLVGAGYFFAWALFGVAIFPLGVTLAALAMQMPLLARAVPIMVGVIIVLAGAFQFTERKTHYLACCRKMPPGDEIISANVGKVWRHGVRLGTHCIACCANLTLILLVVGVMDLSAMVIVTLAITAERLALNSKSAAHTIGAVIIVAGLLVFAKAIASVAASI